MVRSSVRTGSPTATLLPLSFGRTLLTILNIKPQFPQLRRSEASSSSSCSGKNMCSDPMNTSP